jgi:hypothetical protein
MEDSQVRNILHSLISQNKEFMNMFIDYMVNKNKDYDSHEELIESFVNEHLNNINRDVQIRSPISSQRMINSDILCDNA